MADLSVRPAMPADGTAIGRVQVRAWRAAYDGLLPAATLAGLDPDQLAASWAEAVRTAPDSRHRVLVACAGDQVVGYAVLTPAQDPDLDPDEQAELHDLVVDPPAQRAGHGSRLLTACMDTARASGFRTAVMWLNDSARPQDAAAQEFLTTSGWAPDGAQRTLDLQGDAAVVIPQLRLHSALTEDDGKSPPTQPSGR